MYSKVNCSQTLVSSLVQNLAHVKSQLAEMQQRLTYLYERFGIPLPSPSSSSTQGNHNMNNNNMNMNMNMNGMHTSFTNNNNHNNYSSSGSGSGGGYMDSFGQQPSSHGSSLGVADDEERVRVILEKWWRDAVPSKLQADMGAQLLDARIDAKLKSMSLPSAQQFQQFQQQQQFQPQPSAANNQHQLVAIDAALKRIAEDLQVKLTRDIQKLRDEDIRKLIEDAVRRQRELLEMVMTSRYDALVARLVRDNIESNLVTLNARIDATIESSLAAICPPSVVVEEPPPTHRHSVAQPDFPQEFQSMMEPAMPPPPIANKNNTMLPPPSLPPHLAAAVVSREKAPAASLRKAAPKRKTGGGILTTQTQTQAQTQAVPAVVQTATPTPMSMLDELLPEITVHI